jgi:3-oxoacyl-(acyl-carrier-protein) synthase
MIFITRHTHIRNRSLFKQGEMLCRDLRGTFNDFLDTAFDLLDAKYPKFHKMDASSKLGFLASEMLLKDVDLLQEYKPSQVALVLSNAHGSLDTDIRYFESTRTMASPGLFVYTLPNIVAGEICIRNGIKGENAFFVTPSFDIQQMHQYVESAMDSGLTQACIAGWIDVMASHHDVFLYLAEKKDRGNALQHSAVQLQKLYQLKYGTVND